MSISWGNRILLTLIVFVSLMGTLAYKAINTTYELVSPEYYKDELAYQKTIDANNNSNQLTEKLHFNLTDGALQLVVPSEQSDKAFTATAYFYCADHTAFDKTVTINYQPGQPFTIPATELKGSSYTVKLNWTFNNTAYYNEQQIRIK
ncbi:MAG: FixH family protein [Chitinophagaceae bacterium]|nr:FixH family protein [Chitinophagaceae bacterium]